MGIIGISAIVMVSAVLMQSLGLASELAKVCTKIASCVMCTTFWSVLVVLIMLHYNVLVSISIAIMCGFLSNFVALAVNYASQIYDKIWEKLNKNKQ